MKIIYMGTPDFSVPVLEAMIEAGHEVVCVATQPDKQRGRGKAVQFPPVKEAALAHNIPVIQPIKIREPQWMDELKKYNADIFVVAAFGQILPKEILEMPKYGCINVHASLLPKYRGAAPIQWSIIDGEQETGVTIMQMAEGLDTGDMLTKVVVPIEQDETGGSLHDKLSEAGAKLLVETLKSIENGEVTPQPQDDALSCYAKMLRKELGDIDWSASAVSIERLIRGLNPWPSAYTTLGGKTVKIWVAQVLEELANAAPGTIVHVTKDALEVATGDGILRIKELQLEGKKRMDTSAFLRGYEVQTGTVLGQ